MKVEHLAIWTYNLEGMRSFYMHYFDASSGEVYHNHSREYRSYFLTFDGDCRIELMEMPGIPKSKDNPLKQFTGLIHFALKTGSKNKVNELTETLRKDGYKIVSEPRTTGDGFYESVFLDPDGNRVEITA
ncbi:VOC family protein [Draconibacterium sp. IB214405]|uniref:VOC family protein n=1 Tax=Draconibacterium sp. IB214405 TaxID=3097352 RepID=UPI002A0CC67C|nr:VOC family protein [Draconibacterium sp. IB214405]MDX8338302.1 VOC family protein [Draconibacterium sp. IB214405]